MPITLFTQRGATLIESIAALVISSLIILSASQLSLLAMRLEHRMSVERSVSWTLLGELIPQLQTNSCCEGECLDDFVEQLAIASEVELSVICNDATLSMSWLSPLGLRWQHVYTL